MGTDKTDKTDKAKVRDFSGKQITSLWGDGFGSYKVIFKGGIEAKISQDEMERALKKCKFKGTMAKKYYHLEAK